MNSEAHWLLAYYYYKLAIETPELYEEEHDKESKKKHRLCCRGCGYWTGVFFNAIGPITVSLSLLLFFRYFSMWKATGRTDTELASDFQLWGNISTYAFIAVAVSQIVSASVVIWSVNKIRVFVL